MFSDPPGASFYVYDYQDDTFSQGGATKGKDMTRCVTDEDRKTNCRPLSPGIYLVEFNDFEGHKSASSIEYLEVDNGGQIRIKADFALE